MCQPLVFLLPVQVVLGPRLPPPRQCSSCGPWGPSVPVSLHASRQGRALVSRPLQATRWASWVPFQPDAYLVLPPSPQPGHPGDGVLQCSEVRRKLQCRGQGQGQQVGEPTGQGGAYREGWGASA